MRTVKYEEILYERLRDSKYAAAYLAEVLANESYSTFLIALRDIMEARTEGITSLAEETGLTRQALHRIMSINGNPRLSTLNELLKALGLKITITTLNKGFPDGM